MYVAVKGGEAAISAAHELLARERRGDISVPEISTDQIREQLTLAVNESCARARSTTPSSPPWRSRRRAAT
jgi:alpha-D-ribose 1-methylphosphonate 5-triphosphate synthase subunit PhnI